MKRILLYNRCWTWPADELNDYPLLDGFVLTTDHRHLKDAAAIVFHMPTITLEELSHVKKSSGQKWVFWSRECDLHFPWQFEKEIQELFEIHMSYRLNSEVPVPYVASVDIDLMKSKQRIKTEFVSAFISNPFDQSNRKTFLKEMMNHLNIHSFGKILNNKKINVDNGVESKLETINNYKFTIAFENAIAEDYVTEKFFQPLILGSIPIYLGAPNIKKFCPGDNCYIDVNDFSSPKALSEYIKHLDNDNNSLETYLKWKTAPISESLKTIANINDEPEFLRLCRLI